MTAIQEMQRAVFGCTVGDLKAKTDAMIKRTGQTRLQLASSLISHAQIEAKGGDAEQACRTMNVVKWLLGREIKERAGR